MDEEEIILCDSNVIIDWINHQQRAVDDFQLLSGRIAISIITEYEIIAGAMDLNMQKQLEKFLKNYIVVLLDDKISACLKNQPS
jgi:predicted nucleic acid-binding protein